MGLLVFGLAFNVVAKKAPKNTATQTQVIHMALSKFAADVLPAYAPDDGPLTAKQIRALREDVQKHLPKGKSLSNETLFP